MNALLDAALVCAARGIPVYPVHWPRRIPDRAGLACSCPRGRSCDRPAKHPQLRHGVKQATTDPDRIGRWWHRWPQANLGLATGIVFDALDVDGPAGLGALLEFARTADPWLPGPLVATGGGGWHAWFRPTGLGNRPPRGLEHVDWRGRRGCVLAALRRDTPGHRNHTLNRTAFKVYRYVAGGVLDEEAVTTAFSQAALAIGLRPAGVTRTLASARTAGLANPRVPPMGQREAAI